MDAVRVHPAPVPIPARRLNLTVRRVESPLGTWTHAEARPAHLSGLVDFLWHFEGSILCLRERIFPNGSLEIIVHLGGGRYRDVHEDRVSICPEACVTGIQLGAMVIEAPGVRTAVLGIRLTPAGAFAVFGRPMHEVTGLTVDLQDLAGPAAAELQELCGAAATPRARVLRAVEWVEARLRRGVRPDPAVPWMVEQIRACDGAVSIGALRGRAGLSATRLATAFREQVGVSPKQYARITRFHRALERLSRGPVTLAEAALDTGYYDQPHMTAEFKALSGLTPREFLDARRYPNSISIAE